MNLKGKKVAVVGLAKSGFAAAKLLKRQGAKARVTEVSAKDSVACLANQLTALGIDVELGAHTEEFLKGAELMVTSPGVPDTSLPIKWAEKNNIKVIDETELAYSFCKAPIIAITGTNGKSTTASLVGHILAKSGRKAVVCGNIGAPFSDEIDKLDKDSVYVLEISSFQLSRADKFRPKIAVLLNVTQNHLDRHADFNEYFNAKMNIFKNQASSGWAVLNYKDENILKNVDRIKAKKIFFSTDYSVIARERSPERPVHWIPFTGSEGRSDRSNLLGCEEIASSSRSFGTPRNDGVSNFASIDVDRLFVQRGKNRNYICDVSDLQIKGAHNVENALAAVSAARAFGVPDDRIACAIKTFKGLEHRCEYVMAINGVKFINDSKSTTVDAAIKALSCCDGPVVMIAGGRDKNSDFSILRSHVKNKVRLLILIGEAKAKIKNALSGDVDIKESFSLEDAARLAYDTAKRGESVLFSPMCASFDMFEDFEHRGRVFKEIVKALQPCAAQG